MKSVGGAPMSVGGSPMKRARLDHSLHEEQDDIEEIPGKLVVLNIFKILPFYHLSKKMFSLIEDFEVWGVKS